MQNFELVLINFLVPAPKSVIYGWQVTGVIPLSTNKFFDYPNIFHCNLIGEKKGKKDKEQIFKVTESSA